MSKGDNISLSEQVLEEKLKNIQEKIKHLEEKMVMMNQSTEKALVLKSQEDKIHFEKLNGEYVRIDKIVVSNVPREVYEQGMKELSGKIVEQSVQSKDFVTKDFLAATLKTPSDEIKGLTSHKDIQIGKGTMIGAIVFFILGLIGAAGGIISIFN